MRAYSKKDVDRKALQGARIAILGYGSQGRAHALNLKDSGYDVVVGVRRTGDSWKKAKKDGLAVAEPAEAVKGAALAAMMTPGPRAAAVYKEIVQDTAEGRGPALRARIQHPFQADQAAQGSRRGADRAQGSGRPRAAPVPAGTRRAVPDRRRAERHRQGEGTRTRLRRRHRRHACRRHRDDVCRGDRDGSVRRAGRALRRRDRARPQGFRDARRGRLPARGRVLRVPARAEADRRPAA